MKFFFSLLLLFSALLSAEPRLIVSSEFIPHNGEHLPGGGPAIQLVQAALAAEHQAVELVYLPWPRALKMSQTGEAAGIISVWYDKERDQYLHFPTPLYHNEMILLQHKDRPVAFSRLQQKQASQLRLGLVRGYSYPPLIRDSGLALQEVATDLESMTMLALGRVDLVIIERWAADYLLKHQLSAYQTQLEQTGPVLERKPMYLAFSKAHPGVEQLVAAFERGIKKPEVQRLKQRLLKESPYP